jgi:hypothetical protein
MREVVANLGLLTGAIIYVPMFLYICTYMVTTAFFSARKKAVK